MYRRPSNSSSLNSPTSPVFLMTPPILGRGRSKKDNTDKVDDAMFEGFDGVHTEEQSASNHTNLQSNQTDYFEIDVDQVMENSGKVATSATRSVVEPVLEEEEEENKTTEPDDASIVDVTDDRNISNATDDASIVSVTEDRSIASVVDHSDTIDGLNEKNITNVSGSRSNSSSPGLVDELQKITQPNNSNIATVTSPPRSNSSSPGLVDEMRKISVGSHQPLDADASFGSSVYDSFEDAEDSFVQDDSIGLTSHSRPTQVQILEYDEAQVRSPKIRSPQVELSHSHVHSQHNSPVVSRSISMEDIQAGRSADMHSLKGSIHSWNSSRTRDVDNEEYDAEDEGLMQLHDTSVSNADVSEMLDTRQRKYDGDQEVYNEPKLDEGRNFDDSIDSVEFVEPGSVNVADDIERQNAQTPAEQSVFYSADDETYNQTTPDTYRFLLSQANSPSEAPITEEANVKLYHPKPQRLVSASLAETPNVLDESKEGPMAPPEEPITTEPSPDAKHPDLSNSSVGQVVNAIDGSFDDSALIEEYPEAGPSKSSLHDQGVVMDESEFKRSSHDFSANRFSRRPTSSIMEPENTEGLVFYPAPIPVQLRLPPLLSKKNKTGIPVDVKARRRSSVPLAPPTWVINPMDRSSMLSLGQPLDKIGSGGSPSIYSSVNGYDRSPSPTLSIDSGRATIEDDDERNLGDSDDDEGNDTKKKSKGKKKNKNRFSRRITEKDKDGNAIDSDEFDYSSDDENADLNATADHLAFTSFSGRNIAAEVAQSGLNRPPKSLIEELEMRKAGKKIQTQRVRNELEIVNAEQKSGSNHPLDYRQNKSLLQLNHIANRDYEDQVQINKMNRLSRPIQTVTTQAQQDEFADEPLSARRARLKAQKEAILIEAQQEGETLAQRRARLRQERESHAQPSLVA
jgi:hypothetical protein